MNEYIGKICPFCKTEFKEGDEIVVCSSCDMPHHKECWIDNQGCTTFGCMGTIKAVDNSSTSVTATEISYEEPEHVFCTKCGAKNPTTSSFCSRCGNTLKKTPSAPAYTQADPANTNPYAYTQQPTYNPQPNNYGYGQQTGGAVDPDVAAMVGANQGYYIPKFLQMKAQNKQTSWNWVAFFFAPYWFMYRKMYVYGAIAFGVMLLNALIGVPVITYLILGGYGALGVFANNIYMQWVDKNVNQAKMMSEPYKTQFIQKTGGVNNTALIASVVGWFVLFLIISAL